MENSNRWERYEKSQLETGEVIEKYQKGGDIMVYRVMNRLEQLDKEHLLIWDINDTRGNIEKFRKDNCRRDINKFSSPQTCIKLRVVEGRIVHKFTEMLDLQRYGDGTV